MDGDLVREDNLRDIQEDLSYFLEFWCMDKSENPEGTTGREELNFCS